MGWLKPATKIPPQWDAMFIRKLVERIRTSLNFLDASNFPNGVSGAIINNGTLDPRKFANMCFTIPIVALGVGFTTTSTSLISVGGSIPWFASVWGDTVEMRLFITGGSTNVAAIATYELQGVDGTLISATINSASYISVTSDPVSVPVVDQNLVLKIKTSNGSYAAGIINAMLILTPKA